jgi:hypothetical protein
VSILPAIPRSALVQRVSQQLENDAQLSARLDVLLKRVAAGEAIE